MDMNEIKQGLKPGIFGVAVGAAVLAIVGFNWGGWVTGSSAVKMADAAVMERLVPICVGQFNADADKVAKLAEMKKADYWKYGDYVAKQGWATMPGATEPTDEIARACGTKIAS